MNDFVHLHVHSQYSIADGATRIDELVERAKALGMSAVALTDHDNLHGAVHFANACRKHGVKPIYGCCLAIANRPVGEHVLRSHHLTLLAVDLEGYKNLLALISLAHLRAPPGGQPRIDPELLDQHHVGLICLSGDLSGEVGNALLRGQDAEAKRAVERYKEIFGDRFWIEIQDAGLVEQKELQPRLLALAADHGVRCVATNDVHYLDRAGARAHEVLMCIGLGLQAAIDEDWLPTTQLHFADAAEMRARFAAHPQLCDATVEIAAACNVELRLGEVYLPHYQVPDGETIRTYFAKVAREGLAVRLDEKRAMGEACEEQEYRERLELEIDVIERMDFPGYFLIVWDFIRWAKEQRIPVGPGRGSGAGSLVAWSLRITNLDPIPYKLLFERFLNPERVSMPDFDIDFCVNRRGEVIEYVADKYGRDHVAQIATFGTLKAKGAIRDCGRVLGVPLADVSNVAKLVPDQAKNIGEALSIEPRLRELCESDPTIRVLIDTAAQLEGAVRQVGMHAAGVVISEEPLWHYVPVGKGANGEYVSQFAKDEVEEAGLVKFDFLGLKNLTMIQHCVDILNAGRAVDAEPFDIDKLSLTSAEAFAVMSRGETAGIFQMESSGFTTMIKNLQPSEFEDIIAAGALYRPGPLNMAMDKRYIARKHGREKVEVPHPLLEPILRETYGVIVYQEQVMQIARTLAGYTLGGADLLRRAMGKKKKEVMDDHEKIFVAGAIANGVDEEVAFEIFGLMASFAEYGFNKSHAAAYGLITYQTAWLKAHHTTEFFAALLTADQGDTDKVVQYIQEARRAGLRVLPPDITASAWSFTVSDGTIRFGLGAIKNVGEGAIEAIIASRQSDGPFESLYDFCRRVDTRKVNRRVIETLVKCGAFDSFGQARDVLWANIDRAIDRAQTEQRERESGQASLFDLGGGAMQLDDAYLPVTEPWPMRQTLDFEKECLGFYVSGHPLDSYSGRLHRLSVRGLSDLKDPASTQGAGRRVTVRAAVVVTSVRERITQSGTRMAWIGVEDLSGQAEVMAFSRTLESTKVDEALKSDAPLLLTIQLDLDRTDDTRVRLLLEDAELLEHALRAHTRHLRVRLNAGQCDRDRLVALRRLLEAAPGSAEVRLEVRVPQKGEALVVAGGGLRVEPSDDVVGQIERLIGRGSVAIS